MSYFNTNETFFVIPLSTNDGEIEKINFLFNILEKSGVGEIIESANYKSSTIGRKAYNPYKLFTAIIYCFAMHKGTLRNTEEMCTYDLRLQYILNQETPSYKTILEFINEVILPSKEIIFSKITKAIIDEFDINIDDCYLDGTKLEANANKYKFVYKPRKVKTNLENKIVVFLKEINEEINEINSATLLKALKNYEEKNSIKVNEIKTGKGIRTSREEKLCILGYKYLDKLLEYEEKEMICGENRNSYYKTDKDATAMALKADYYSGHGSNMKAAYNVQFIVSSGLILMYGVFQNRTDYHTLIPMIDKYNKNYNSVPKNLCADAGYGIYENYKYMKSNSINNYVKYQSWSNERNGKNPQKFFLDDEDNFYCLNSSKGEVILFKESHQKIKNSKMYKFNGCLSCEYEYICKKNYKNRDEDFRRAELSIENEKYKNEARENLKSLKGIEIRVNRSIQIEGTFGNLKQNLGYVRIRRRGMEKVSCEIMLMSLASNIRKLFSFLNNKNIKSKYWELKSDTKPEEFKEIKPKKRTVRN